MTKYHYRCILLIKQPQNSNPRRADIDTPFFGRVSNNFIAMFQNHHRKIIYREK